ncbi:MAG TPA: GNAT family N-acetyltransferase [Gaiellales bacterium]|jgi:ribosomal protein S18 acetylase RimI-like enzyme|nr:GNAT family N-acetyltransferase [Gaiellales bacterium]
MRARELTSDDRAWVRGILRERWGAPVVVSRGVVHEPETLPGFVAEDDGEAVGLVTYRIAGRECEIVTIDALVEEHGVGTILLDAVTDAARAARCRRLWLITTNDNLRALRFYQRRGFFLVAVHRDAATRSREIKPTIPEVGEYGIPIRDELELELPL